MYNKVVIGIDQSYTRSGVSVAADGMLLKVGCVSFKDTDNHCTKRKKLTNIVVHLIDRMSPRASELVIVVERIRQFSGGVLSMDYIKATGALIGAIVDVADGLGVPVYSADTKSWKSQVVGTSKAAANVYNVEPKKWPTIEFLLKRDDVSEHDLLVSVGKRAKYYAKQIEGVNYKYNDDAADSACIALYGFSKGRNLKREY